MKLSADRWYPIGRADDAPLRHVLQSKLLGQELAVWRADDGFVNVWQNRCLHRGVRLSAGLNQGLELTCMYHGWRYASRTGGCTYIPAHPADAPARTICNRTYAVAEAHGLIWTALADPGAFEGLADPPEGETLTLRSLPFSAPPDVVHRHLLQYRFRTAGWPDDPEPDRRIEPTFDVAGEDPARVDIRSEVDGRRSRVILLIQPTDTHECTVHGILADHGSTGRPTTQGNLALWQHHAKELDRIRTLAEATAAIDPELESVERPPGVDPITGEATGVAVQRAGNDRSATLETATELRVEVVRKWMTAADVAAFELAPLDGVLPTAQPGAHIDVKLPNGLVRQYSLTNRAGSQERYVIGVKREPESRGGSSCLHETVEEGDVLAISPPRNNFGLRRDALHTVFLAGGIGLTPLLAMAETLHADGQSCHLHSFVRSDAHQAFADRLDRLGDRVVRHVGLGPQQTVAEMARILATRGEANQLYICGPAALLDAARSAAADAGWPEDSVHFEYFANPTEIDDSKPFRISLARSALTLEVPEGRTILSVLQDNGVTVASSCEQGACGTCVVGLLRGDPVHQDVYLRPSEREAGDRIVTCVSRAASDELVLDI